MNKRIEEEIALKKLHPSAPRLMRLPMPGIGRPVAVAAPNEVQLPTADTIQAAKQVGDRRARAVLEGLSPDLTDEELSALEASVEARNERVSEKMELFYARIDRIGSNLETGHGNTD